MTAKPAALLQRAAVALSEGRTALAGRLLRQAAATSPFVPQAGYNLGVYLRASGEARQAATWLERSVRAAPDYVAAWIELGLARLALDQPAAAEEAFERALALDPQDADALRGGTTAAFRCGRWAAAAERLAALGARATYEDDLLRARALLEAGQRAEAEALLRRLGGADPALAPELLKAITRRAKGGFPLDEGRLAVSLGLAPGNVCDSRPADR